MKPVAADPQSLQREEERRLAAEVLAELSEAAGSADAEALLRAVQARIGYVPPPALPLVAERVRRERYEVYRLVEASAELCFDPPGRHRVAICRGENCTARGSARLGERAQRLLGIGFRQVTDDRAVRLDPFVCLGQCGKGPNVRIDDTVYTGVDEAKLTRLLAALRRG